MCIIKVPTIRIQKITKVALCAYYRATTVACQYQKDNFGCFLHIHQNTRGVFVFYDRFIELCNHKKVSRTKACIDCGVSRTAWHKWEDGATPNGTTINKFAAYFGVAVGYLLGEENQNAPTGNGERTVSDKELKFALWGNCEDISDDDLADVLRYAAFVRERKKDKK